MKTKKSLAILLALAMIFSLLAAAPVSAVGSELEANGKWSPLTEKPNNDAWSAPTVEGFDGYVNATGDNIVGTTEAYDLNVNTLVLSGLNIADGIAGQWSSLIFRPDRLNSNLFATNASEGALCFLVQKGNTTVSFNLWTGSGLISGVNVPEADEYRISFVVTVSTDGSKLYGFRVNNTYCFGSWVEEFCKSASFDKCYIILGASYRTKTNVKIAEEDEFVSTRNGSLDEGQVTDFPSRDGFQKIYCKDGISVGTSAKYDFTKKAFYLNDSVTGWYKTTPLDGSGAFMWFAQERRTGGTVFGTDSTDGLLAFYLVWHSDRMDVILCKNNAYPVIAKIPHSESYQVWFDEDNKALVINGYYIFDGSITNFINGGFARNSYLSVGGMQGLWANAKIADIEKPEWITDKWSGNGITKTADLLSGGYKYSAGMLTALATYEKKNITETTLRLGSLSGDKLAEVDAILTLGFGAEGHIKDTRVSDADNGVLTFDFYILKDADGNITGLRPHIGSGAQIGAVVPVSDSYTFTLGKIGDEYHLFVNGVKYSNDAITAFCSKYTEAYISVCSYANTLEYIPAVLDNRQAFDFGWVSLQSSALAAYPETAAGYAESVYSNSGNNAVSLKKFDLLNEGISFGNVDMSGAWVRFNFNTSRHTGFTANSADNLTVFLLPVSNGYNVAVGWENGIFVQTDVTVAAAESYTFYAAKDTSGYSFFINETRIPIDEKNSNKFTEFCESGAVSSCYLAVAAADRFSASTKIVTSNWETLGGAVRSVNPANGNLTSAYLTDGARVRYNDSFSIRNSSIILSGLSIDGSEQNSSATVLFTKDASINEIQAASDNCLGFVLSSVENSSNIAVSVVSDYGGLELLGEVPAAASYKIGFAYSVSSGKYALKVNNTVLTDNTNSDEITAFCLSDGEYIYSVVGSIKANVAANIEADLRDYAYGDVDESFERDILDAVLAARAAADEDIGETGNRIYADADDNGIVNGDDVSAIIQIILNDDINGFAYAN